MILMFMLLGTCRDFENFNWQIKTGKTTFRNIFSRIFNSKKKHSPVSSMLLNRIKMFEGMYIKKTGHIYRPLRPRLWPLIIADSWLVRNGKNRHEWQPIVSQPALTCLISPSTGTICITWHFFWVIAGTCIEELQNTTPAQSCWNTA